METPSPLTPGQVRELDRITIEEYGVPGRLLMEVAGYGAARELTRLFPEPGSVASVLALCGVGNNAGDGFVVARLLACWGYRVDVQLVAGSERFSPDTDAGANLQLLPRFGVAVIDDRLPRLEGRRLVIDALLGTGLSGAPREPFATAIEAMNSHSAPVFALDCPSGLDGESGTAAGAAVKARWTVGFGCPKVGLCHPKAAPWVGEQLFVPLSFPAAARDRLGG